MNVLKILGVILLIAGTLCLVYKGFTYTKETHKAEFGPLELQVKEKEHVSIPVWAGIVMIAAGGVLLLVPVRKS